MQSMALFIPEMLQVAQRHGTVRVAGIDLGTTNSAVADILWPSQSSGLIKTGCVEVAQKLPGGDNGYKSILVPSVAALHDNTLYIGEGAKRLRAHAAELGLAQNMNLFYECKNDMGIRKTYVRAPEGFRSAAEIGGKILAFLHRALRRESRTPVRRTVITVPASFQSSQRRDTLRAAELAGLPPDTVSLLDEPIAAFLDYLACHRDVFSKDGGAPKNLLVFDFGGGTCDVAILSVAIPETGFPVNVFPRAVSRYHRLGGGDIDRAIVYEVLIPKLIAANNLKPFDLTYDDKRECIEPALLDIAEDLKTGLCDEISRLQQKAAYAAADKQRVACVIPGIFTISVRGVKLVLNCPELNAAEFEKLLEPFLDEDLLYARESEYRMVCSVVAPLQDALDRGKLDGRAIDYLLMLGGSCRIPQVANAVKKLFPCARLLTFPDQESLQAAVARGAAFHALCLELCGKGIVRQVCCDAICLREQSGVVELVPQGAELPYPSARAYKRLCSLAVPRTALHERVEVKVELTAGPEQRLLHRAVWSIPGPVNRGDPLCVEYRYDENQVLDIRIKIEDTGTTFTAVIENPLTNVVNPQSKMATILEAEEKIRTGAVPPEEMPEKLITLSQNYADLGHREKAMHALKQALKAKGGPDPEILNKLGICALQMGDYERAEKFYREAMRSDSWSGPVFNLALLQRRRGQYEQGAATIEQALSKNREAPYLVLKALLAADTGNHDVHASCLQEALRLFGPVERLSDWELGWYLTAAKYAGADDRMEAAKVAQRKRLEKNNHDPCAEALLPILRPGLVKA